jgi:hypothetical protein
MMDRETATEYIINCEMTTNEINEYEIDDYVVLVDEAIDTINQVYDDLENRTCEECKYSRETNLKNETSSGELFCVELVRFFHTGFCCNKWEQKNGIR